MQKVNQIYHFQSDLFICALYFSFSREISPLALSSLFSGERYYQHIQHYLMQLSILFYHLLGCNKVMAI